MIVRIWQGWTTPANADAYEKLLREEIFPEIQSKEISGLNSIELLRLQDESETRFMTLFRFKNVEAIKRLAGDDEELAYVPVKAKVVLKRYEDRASHFELRFSAVDSGK